MRLVLLGLPGAGKGAQGERIAAYYGIPHISTGDIIRRSIASQSSMGREADRHISQGHLIPDKLAEEIVRQRLRDTDCHRGWILDGYPRTIHQARDLDRMLAKCGSEVDIAFEIRIREEQAIGRVAERRICRDCGATYHLQYYRVRGKGLCERCGGELHQRNDDNERTAFERLRVYMEYSHPVVHYYAQQGRLYSIDGERAIDEVFKDVQHVLDVTRLADSVGEVS